MKGSVKRSTLQPPAGSITNTLWSSVSSTNCSATLTFHFEKGFTSLWWEIHIFLWWERQQHTCILEKSLFQVFLFTRKQGNFIHINITSIKTKMSQSYLAPWRTGVDCISYSKNSQVQKSDGSSSPIILTASPDRVTLVIWISNRFCPLSRCIVSSNCTVSSSSNKKTFFWATLKRLNQHTLICIKIFLYLSMIYTKICITILLGSKERALFR